MAKRSFITLCVRNNNIKCCLRDENKLVVYSLKGELLRTLGTRGSDDAGQFKWPFIFGDDDDGSVLTADCHNDRLQVMSEQGEFSLLQLEPPVSRPYSAVLWKNHVFVSCGTEGQIKKYVPAVHP